MDDVSELLAKRKRGRPRKNPLINNTPNFHVVHDDNKVRETDEEVAARIKERFDILGVLAQACTVGNCRALIVSGPPGLGKSYTVEQTLAEWDPSGVNHIIVKGYCRATGLYKLLWQYREEGQVIVFDDADSIFYDETALNLLKTACDTTETRRPSWLAETQMMDEDGATLIDRTFEYNGTIIFISNLDFYSMIDNDHKLTPHLSAMVSRSFYIDLEMKSRRDYLVRIFQVIEEGLLDFLPVDQQMDVVTFIENHSSTLRELSLRMAIKLGKLRASSYGYDWEKLARITCCRN